MKFFLVFLCLFSEVLIYSNPHKIISRACATSLLPKAVSTMRSHANIQNIQRSIIPHRKIKGIVVEGTDCSGKTTLMDVLKSRLCHLGWDIVNLGHRDGNQFDRYMSHYLHADKVIFDRGHFSEIVHGNLWRAGHGMSTKEVNDLNEYVFTNFLVIFVHAPEEILKERYYARAFNQIIKSDELAIVQSRLAALLTHPYVLKYDSSSLNERDVMVEKVLLLLNNTQA
ncbi:MAG: hypothetical protein K2X90_03615 [Candidatus Babeliaceae bacterium]|nr:hypothetical protein [Candidatus Babeliaceae bacterium]